MGALIHADIKKSILFVIMISSLTQYSCIYAAEETATKFATVSIETVVGKTVEGLSVAGPSVSVVAQTLAIGMEIKSHIFPNEEEEAHANAVEEKYSLLTAEKELESCMMKNRSSLERGPSGRPTACQEIARLLVVLGGKAEVNRVTSIYNQFRK